MDEWGHVRCLELYELSLGGRTKRCQEVVVHHIPRSYYIAKFAFIERIVLLLDSQPLKISGFT